jgi:hypothetical protein
VHVVHEQTVQKKEMRKCGHNLPREGEMRTTGFMRLLCRIEIERVDATNQHAKKQGKRSNHEYCDMRRRRPPAFRIIAGFASSKQKSLSYHACGNDCEALSSTNPACCEKVAQTGGR